MGTGSALKGEAQRRAAGIGAIAAQKRSEG
jgi:hypothetical protein